MVILSYVGLFILCAASMLWTICLVQGGKNEEEHRYDLRETL